MDITITTWADAPQQENVKQETRLTADARTHVAIHLGQGVYLHLSVNEQGYFALTTGDYRTGHEWLMNEVAQGNAVNMLAQAIGKRSDDRAMYERLYQRIMNSREFNLRVGDDLIDLLARFGMQANVAGPEWDGGMHESTDQRRASEWRKQHEA